MPAIGSISFSLGGHDSGVAMRLARSASKKVSVGYGEAQLHAAPDTPYVVCQFDRAKSHLEAFAKGSLLLQEALDLLSITGQGDLATREAQDEYLVWWTDSESRYLAVVTTFTLSSELGHVQLTASDPDGNASPPNVAIPTHHLGFRFYRLSQVSDDLFDAYRNMYLAFESLLSSRFPKKQPGQEITWLETSLANACTDLALRKLAPPAAEDPAKYILDVIYKNARLPLFHAKDGRAYFAPDRPKDRTAVSEALGLLTPIVIRMAETWFKARRIGGWINPKLIEDGYKAGFGEAHFVFTDNPNFSLRDSLESLSIAGGQPFSAEFRESFNNDPRQHVFGEVDMRLLAGRGPFHALYLVNAQSVGASLSLDTTIDLSGFHRLQTHVFLRSRNASAPKFMFVR